MIRGRRLRPKRWPIPKWQLRPKRQPKSRPFWSQHSIPARPDTTRHRKTLTRYHADLSCAPNPSGYAPNSHTGGDPLDWLGQADPISTFGHFKRGLVSKGRSRLTKPQFTHGANWGLLRVMRLECQKVESSLPPRGESLICKRSQRCSSYASSRRATSSMRIVSPCLAASTVTSMNAPMSVM